MSDPTLTGLVDDALAVLAPGARPATLFYHPQVAALYAALPRYEAAMRLAEAWEVRRVAEHLWWAASDSDGPTDSRLVNACNCACRDFDRAAAAYREARP